MPRLRPAHTVRRYAQRPLEMDSDDRLCMHDWPHDLRADRRMSSVCTTSGCPPGRIPVSLRVLCVLLASSLWVRRVATCEFRNASCCRAGEPPLQRPWGGLASRALRHLRLCGGTTVFEVLRIEKYPDAEKKLGVVALRQALPRALRRPSASRAHLENTRLQRVRFICLNVTAQLPPCHKHHHRQTGVLKR